MKNTEIKIVVNGRTYSLRAENQEAFQYISEPDRIELLALLDAIKSQSESVQGAGVKLDSAEPEAHQSAPQKRSPPSPHQAHRADLARASKRLGAVPFANPTRPGKGDIDDVMAKLILEEKSQQPAGLTKGSIYKFVGISLALVIVLVLVF